MSNVKAVLVENSSTVNIGHQNGSYLEKGGFNVTFWFCDPEKAHTHAEPRLLHAAVLAVGERNKKRIRANQSKLEVMHAWIRNP